jgi:hypothetical protein
LRTRDLSRNTSLRHKQNASFDAKAQGIETGAKDFQVPQIAKVNRPSTWRSATAVGSAFKLMAAANKAVAHQPAALPAWRERNAAAVGGKAQDATNNHRKTETSIIELTCKAMRRRRG